MLANSYICCFLILVCRGGYDGMSMAQNITVTHNHSVVSSVGGAAMSAASSAAKTAKHVGQSAEKTAKSVGHTAMSAASGIGHGVENGVSGVADGAKNAASGLGHAVSGLASNIGNTVSGAASNMVNTAKKTVSNVGNLMSNVANGLKKGLNKVKEMLSRLVVGFMNIIIQISGNIENTSGNLNINLKDLEKRIKTSVNQLINYISKPQESVYAASRSLIRRIYMQIEKIFNGLETNVIKLGGKMDKLTIKSGQCVTEHSKDIPKHVYKNIVSCLVGKVNQVIDVGANVLLDIKLGGKIINTAVLQIRTCKDLNCIVSTFLATVKNAISTIFHIILTIARVAMFVGTLAPSIPLCFSQQVGLKTPLLLVSVAFYVAKCIVK